MGLYSSHTFRTTVVILAAFCLIGLVVDAAPSYEEKCDSMWESFQYLCPSKVSSCREVEADALDKSVRLNWQLMVALAKAEKRIEGLEEICSQSMIPDSTTIATSDAEAETATEVFTEESTNPDLTTMPTTTTTTTTSAATTTTTEIICGKEGHVYAGKCYTVSLTDGYGYDMNYTEAVNECKENGSLPAEIHNQDQQIALQKFLRTKIPPLQSVIEIWTGMKYNTTTSTIRYRSGDEKPTNNLMWYPSYPSRYTQNKGMAIDVRPNGEGDEGVWNYQDIYSLQGVVCERDI